jgi:glutathione S-transferase
MHSGFGALRAQLPMHVRRTPDAYRWDEAAQRDIDRVQQLWRELRARHGAGGDFLFGGFGIVDAMFAPVAWRFAGYGVPMDDVAARYVDALLALPAMQEWRAASEAETTGYAGTDALVRG